MQEYGWLNWNDLFQMIERVVPGGDRRKVRLAACALARRVSDRMPHPRSLAALDAAEDYADFRVSRQHLKQAYRAARDVEGVLEANYLRGGPHLLEEWSFLPRPESDSPEVVEARLRLQAGSRPEVRAARVAAAVAAPPVFDTTTFRWLYSEVTRLQNPAADPQYDWATDCALLRDIFGNPFRPTAPDPSWRTEAVVALAAGVYESRDFAPMPVLADALEDAGCSDADVLAHCRGPGPHVRGCWVVDLVLGKD